MFLKFLVVKYYTHVASSPYLIQGTKNANHSVIISQDPDSMNYIPIKRSENEEGIELLRALEIGLKIKSPELKGNSFAVEVRRDYIKAKKYIKKDKFYKYYNTL